MELIVTKISETYIQVRSEPAVEAELSEYFTFILPGARFMPAFRRGSWDGRIRLYNSRTRQIYAGLLPKILEFAKDREYAVSGYLGPRMDSGLLGQIEPLAGKYTPPGIQARDYQLNTLKECIISERRLILSATGSGKSFSIYLVARHFDEKTLIIVPTVGLCYQMENDFKDYGYTEPVHVIHSGKEKQSPAKITVGTWQSLHKLPKEYFKQFGMVIVDEAHLATAKSITSIMEKMDSTKLRFGFTGTIDDSKCNALVLQGLFGEIFKAATTSELIEKKVLSDLRIECITIKYPDAERLTARGMKYDEEMDFLVRHPKRNAIIKNLATKLPGNTLILFQFVEKHGKELYESIKAATDRPVFYISGEVKPKEREEIRKRMNEEKNAILVASTQTTSTGINIVELKNIIFASPSKAKIRTLQSIGRVLRRSTTKTQAVLFDIADDLTHKKRQNYTLKHFIERLKIYNREKFTYKLRSIEIGEQQK